MEQTRQGQHVELDSLPIVKDGAELTVDLVRQIADTANTNLTTLKTTLNLRSPHTFEGNNPIPELGVDFQLEECKALPDGQVVDYVSGGVYYTGRVFDGELYSAQMTRVTP